MTWPGDVEDQLCNLTISHYILLEQSSPFNGYSNTDF